MVESLSAPIHHSPEALYRLLAGQVESYHRHYHLGSNTSISAELAQELLASIGYTLNLSGGDFLLGQAILQEKYLAAQRELQLLTAMSDHGSQWYWDALAGLGWFLQRYDYLHFAHRYPEDIFYPTGAPMPEGLQGLEWVMHYLGCLRREQEILACFPDGAVEELFACAPPDHWAAPENLCQQPLWNGLGRSLLDLPLDSLFMPPAPSGQLSRADLDFAAERVCQDLALEGDLQAYAKAVMAQVYPRLEAALSQSSWAGVFW